MRSDSDWARAVSERYGLFCAVCGHYGYVEHDHIWPKSQGRKDPRVRDVSNGLPVCGQFCPWCRAEGKRTCHEAKTRGEIQYRPEILAPTQVAFLAEVGWVAWDENGQPYGPGMRHFTPASEAARMVWPALVR